MRKAHSWLLNTFDFHNNDSTPHLCDSVLHLLQYPRNIPLDKETSLRQFSLSNITVVHPCDRVLMKIAPLSVIQVFLIFLCHNSWQQKSTRRDSNPRPSPWQGDTPPLSHSCMMSVFQPNNMYYTDVLFICQPIFQKNLLP